ncbi:NLR family CARD domain-containing protein 4-like [Glandiceps talaboti]
MRHEMRRVGMDDNKILGEIVAKNTERGYIELDKLFIPSNEDEIPKRILMEGEAGIGKTTVCRKLAYDWRTGKKYIREMFAAVILLDMKRFKGSLKLSLANQGLVSKAIDLDQLWHYIESHSEDFLWIIDGLDELNPGSKEEIVELIKGDTFRSSTVLTTARICQWETVVEFDEVLFDREIINVGFHFELAKSFIESYFKSKSAVFDYMPFIEVLSKDSQLKDLSRNPLMCIILCFLWEDDAFTKLGFEREYIDSYKLLIAMRRWLCKRYVESHKKEISQKIFDERINIIRELAFIGLEQSKQQFGIDEISEMFPAADIQDDDVIFNIGMLAKEMSVTNIEVEHISYAFPHKLMQDELAGEYFSQLPSTKRQEHYTKLIETPPLHPVLLYGTMLLKHEGREEELAHFYADLTQHVSNIQGDWFAVTDPIFTDPVGVLAFQCLSTSGQPEQLANSLADELQKRKVTRVHLRPYDSVSLSSAYSKGLLYIVSETKYKDFMQKLVIDDIDGFPVWFGEIITKIKPSLGEKIVQTFSV